MSRLFLIAVGATTVVLDGGQFHSVDDLLALFNRFDAGWYASIVEQGYVLNWSDLHPGANNYAFYPVLPILVAGAKALTGLSTGAAGVFVANLFFFAALLLVFRYALHLGLSETGARLSILLLAFAPQSYVFSSTYSESVFLFLLAAAMLALRQERYWVSGLAAAILSATRGNGFAFMAFALSRLLRLDGWGAFRMWDRPKRYLPLVLAPAGFIAFCWYGYWTTGDGFVTMASHREGWGRSFEWPFLNMYVFLFRYDSLAKYILIAMLLFFALSLLLLKQRHFDEFNFCAASFLLYWTVATNPTSLVRLTIVLFPIFIGLARELQGRRYAAIAAVVAFAIWDGVTMVLWVRNSAAAV